MPEDGQDDGEPDQQRDRADHQAGRDDQAPGRHRAGVLAHGAERGRHRLAHADIAVEQQREGDDADRQHQQGEQEADADARDDHRPALRRGHRVAREGNGRDRLIGTERHRVDEVGGGEPQREQADQDQAQRHDRADRGRADDGEGVGPAGGGAELAPAAHLVEADAEQGRDQGEARDQREDQRQHPVVEGEARDDQAGDGIDHAQEDHVGAAGAEVAGALAQRLAQVVEPDLAHDRWRHFARLPGAVHGAGGRADGLSGFLEAIPTPFHGVPDVVLHGHGCLLPDRWKVAAQVWRPVALTSSPSRRPPRAAIRHEGSLRRLAAEVRPHPHVLPRRRGGSRRGQAAEGGLKKKKFQIMILTGRGRSELPLLYPSPQAGEEDGGDRP